MRQAAAALVVVVALGACAVAPGGVSPAGSAPPVPAVSSTPAPSVPERSILTRPPASPTPALASRTPSPATPTPSLAPLEGARNDALVVLLDHEGPDPGDEPPADTLHITLEALAPDGTRRTLRQIADVRAAGWPSGRAVFNTPVALGAGGHLLITAEPTGRLPGGPISLILDLDAPAAAPREIRGELWNPRWGPGGRLAWEDGDIIRVLDPATGILEAVTPPANVAAGTYWLADGSGWLASQSTDDLRGSTFGRLTLAGRFEPGLFPLYQPTGLERVLGARGSGLGTAVDDGPVAVVVLSERDPELPPPCHCRSWIVDVQPGDDPAFNGGIWDAEGNGVWSSLHEDGVRARARLSHFAEPEAETPVAALEPATDWTIVGAAPDDSRIALRSEDRRELVLVDTASGAVVSLAAGEQRDHPPYLVGWSP